VLTVPRLLAWAWRLKRGPIEVYPGLQRARIPMRDATSGQEINWSIEHLPSLPNLPAACPAPAPSDPRRARGIPLKVRATAGQGALSR
jgi:hypothetical protein